MNEKLFYILLSGLGVLLVISFTVMLLNRLTFREGFDAGGDSLKAAIQNATNNGDKSKALQGAYEQFLKLHADFCQVWTPFLDTGMKYEQQSASNETGNGGSAVGAGTPKEYVRLLSAREKKTFVDCSVSFPENIDVGMSAQQMPYESQAYLDSITYGTTQLKKIQDDTKKALAGVPASPAGTASPSSEGFLDLTSQNCENKDGVIRCVISIDTTNKNIVGRLQERLTEILGAEGKIRVGILEFQKQLRAVQDLQERAKSGDIARDVTVKI